MSSMKDDKKSMDKTNNTELRKLPSVEQVLISPEIQTVIAKYSRALVTMAVQAVIAENRNRIMGGNACPGRDEIFQQVMQRIINECSGLFRTVINGTGVVLHTNLGRSPLSDEAITRLSEMGRGYCNLEYDLASGQRGVRVPGVEKLLCMLTGAESALVVNNNAGAVFLIFAVLASGREAVVSRGELVQIGGGFRIPEIMEVAGVRLKEVGTTNKTFIQDYECAINNETALLLKVHTSNFAIRGFTHSASMAELKELGNKYNLPLVYDIGSGAFLDTADYGLEHEPMVQEALADGADLVCFSGDKLLGGPQAGIVLGKREYINRIRKHPLLRIMRIDKMSAIALETTIMHYLKKEATDKIPIWQMISAGTNELRARAGVIVKELVAAGIKAEIMDGSSMIGGGSLPDQTLQSILIAIESPLCPLEDFALKLRLSEPSVIGRIDDGNFLIDTRTVLPSLDDTLIEIIKKASV